jgi:PAS domain S-box-containing protein
MAMALSHTAVCAQPAPTPKRILVLYWYNKDWPSNAAFGQSFQTVLRRVPPGSVEYYAESLESDRFPGENQAQLLRDYLRQKYADRRIDVVVAVSDAALDFFLRYRRDLFPQAPIVFVASRLPAAKELAVGPGMTGVHLPITYSETVDLALKLHPDTQQVFVISGTLEHDKRYEMLARQELADFEDKVEITYLTDLSPDELVAKTQSLPERSVVLYIWQQVRNEQGTLLESRDVLDLFAHTTSAPVYGISSWQVGKGIVGGYLRYLDANAPKTADIALRIANGERAQNIRIESTPVVRMFDWRELQRWGISEDRLPPGSIIEFRTPSFWEQYRGYAIALIALFIIESGLILGLVINRGQRRRAEMALRESEERFRNMADTAPVMIWMSDANRQCIYLNQRWLDFTGRSLEEELGEGWAEGVHPEDYEMCLNEYKYAFNLCKPFTVEYRHGCGDGKYRWVYGCGIPRISTSGEFLGYIGTCMDITGRKAAEQALMDLSGQLIHAREDERARIARELHDDLNQRVALLSIELDQLSHMLSEIPTGPGEMMQEMIGQARDLSTAIHRLSHDLHPSKLTHFGLVTTVRSLCAELSEGYGLNIEFRHDGVPATLAKDISLCLYRIAQESLNNVIRHSGARNALVELSGTEERIRLRISDSGKGFDMESARSRGGLGLLSMRERLRLVGGELSIDSQPSRGTRITVAVPLIRPSRHARGSATSDQPFLPGTPSDIRKVV